MFKATAGDCYWSFALHAAQTMPISVQKPDNPGRYGAAVVFFVLLYAGFAAGASLVATDRNHLLNHGSRKQHPGTKEASSINHSRAHASNMNARRMSSSHEYLATHWISELLRSKASKKLEGKAMDVTNVRVTQKQHPRQQPRGATLVTPNDIMDVWIMAGDGVF